MEVLGSAHPAVSTAAATMQKSVDQARPAPAVATAQSAAAPSSAAAEQVSFALTIDDTVRPINATSESVLEARAPVDPTARAARAPSGDEVSPDSETYEFPEELPMNFLEMIDMWRVEEPPSATGMSASDALSVADPARASEAQRLNRTA